MDEILIEGIRSYAFHGCLPAERKTGGYFNTTVKVTGNFLKAAEEDDLKLAVDYVTVSKIVISEMKVRADLIETIAYRILNALRTSYPAAHKIDVSVTKERAPIELDVQQVTVKVSG